MNKLKISFGIAVLINLYLFSNELTNDPKTNSKINKIYNEVEFSIGGGFNLSMGLIIPYKGKYDEKFSVLVNYYGSLFIYGKSLEIFFIKDIKYLSICFGSYFPDDFP